MFPPKFLLVVAITFWLSLSYFHFEAYGDASGDATTSPNACLNCSKCDPPCQQQSPPVSGYSSYAAPPPPPPSSSPSGYSIYGAPPPPREGGQSKCPPSGGGVQCCTPPPPPYNTYGYGPPYPYYGPPYAYYAPPNPYTYVPYGEGSTILPIQVLLTMLFSCFIFLF